MSMIRGILKTAVVGKVIQVASRELQKPENQRRIKQGLSKLTNAARQKR